MAEYGITYMLEVLPTDCTCEVCEDLRLAGYQTCESLAHLGDLFIGSDCCARSVEEAFYNAENICQMFHCGELGYQPEKCFTPQAIEHVRRRREGKREGGG